MRYAIIIAALLASGPTQAVTDNAILTDRCVACHDIKGPAAQSVEELWSQKGPDLFYAGSKYKRDWLVNWLSNPKRIRPAGYLYFNNIKPGEKRDEVDTEKLEQHISLTKEEANTVADTLMALKATPGLIKEGDFQGGSISISFGEMAFDKFNGCMACHQIEPDFGGLSGPEVYTAAKRLQEDYMVSFIRNPQAWNPKAPMPNRHVNEPNIQKLVSYLVALSKENADEK